MNKISWISVKLLHILYLPLGHSSKPNLKNSKRGYRCKWWRKQLEKKGNYQVEMLINLLHNSTLGVILWLFHHTLKVVVNLKHLLIVKLSHLNNINLDNLVKKFWDNKLNLMIKSYNHLPQIKVKLNWTRNLSSNNQNPLNQKKILLTIFGNHKFS